MEFLRKTRKKRLSILLGLSSSIIIAAVLILFFGGKDAIAAWFDESWAFRRRIPVTNNTTAETNVYVTIANIDTSDTAKFQADCGDIRFTKENGQLLDYYIVSGCGTATTTLHVQFDTLIAGVQDIYMYYGNPSAANGFAGSDFSTQASNYSVGSLASEEKSQAPMAYWKFDEGYGITVNNSFWKKSGTTTNLITNPSIEVNTTGQGYCQNATCVRSSDKSGYGGNSIKATSTAAGAVLIGQTTGEYLNVSASTQYTGSFWVYSTTGGQTAYLYLIEFTGGGTYVTEGIKSSAFTIPANTWTRVSGTFTTGGTTGQVSVRPYWTASAGGQIVYFDGMQLETGATANLYCDGSLTGNGSHAWNGTAHASSSTCDTGTDGQLNGATWQTENMCVSGKCLFFNGSNAFASVPHNSSLNVGTSSFSVQLWFKTSSTVPDSNGTRLIKKGYDSTNAVDVGWELRIDNNNKPKFTIGYWTNEQFFQFPDAINDGKWHFINAIVDKANNKFNGYLDGQLVVNNQSITWLTSLDNTRNLFIGAHNGSSQLFTGFIDEPKIYAYARSAAQIKADYAARGTSKGSAATLSSSKGQGDFLSNGLVGYWKMDEASWTNDCTATSVTDSSGNGNNGSACPATTGPTGGAAGKFGNAGIFDGTEDYITITDTTSLSTTDSNDRITVSAWVYQTGQTNYDRIVNSGWANDGAWLLSIDANYKPAFLIKIGGAQYYSIATNAISTNTWYHITGVYDGTKVTVYVNGVGQTPSTCTNCDINNNNSTIRISESQATEGFTGTLDDVRIYNRALSPKEVRDLYNWAPGPTAYWNFDEKTGQAANDISGNGLSGTLGANSSPGSDDPTWTTGKYGGALSFDGSTDYINAGTSSLLEITNEQTIEFWIYPQTQLTNYTRALSRGGWQAKGYTIYSGVVGDNTLYPNFGSDVGWSGQFAPSIAYSLNQWQHVAITTKLGSYGKSYLNGKYLGSSTPPTYYSGTTSSFRIGGETSGCCFNGKIDDVRVYNYARTQKQIVEDMNAGHPAPGSPVGSAVGNWKFDEGYGTTVYDSSPIANNGTFGASPRVPTWTNNGKFGKALNFDASTPANGDVVNLTDNTAYQATTGLTLSAWVNPNTATGNSTEWIIARAIGVSPYDDYRLIRTSGGAFSFGVRLASGLVSASTTNSLISTNTWYHVVGTYDAITGNAYIYVNGVRRGSGTGTGNIQVSSTRFKIGCWSTAADNCDSTTPFNGLIDEVKVYNSALTEDEVKLDYNRGAALVMGATSTDSSGNPDNSSAREYCIPGDTTSCSAPVGEWNFEEKTGGSANDSSGNGSTGTWNGTGTHWGLGKYGTAGVFNYGSSDWLNLGSPSPLQITGSISFSAWVNITGYSVYNEAIGKSNNTFTNRSFELRTAVTTGVPQTIVFAGASCTGYSAADTAALSTNTWHHLQSVYDSSAGTLKLYVDGTLRNTNTSISGSICNPTEQLAIGALGYFTGGTGFNGKIDQARIFNYARTPAQIAWDYNRGGPVGWWKMDECQGGTANDASGNSNNGTITIGATGSQASVGTCAASAATAWYNGATGKRNASLNFDGTDDYVNVANSNSLNFGSNDFSISFYTYRTAAGFQGGSYLRKGNFTAGIDTYDNIFRVNTSTGELARVALNATQNQWEHHVFTVTQNSTPYIKHYINGVLNNTGYSGTGNLGTFNSDSYDLRIGHSSAGGTNRYFNGQIDDAKIFNYAITPVQVKTLYNDGAVRFGPATGSP